MCQIDVLYGKSLIIDFLDDFLKKRTAIVPTDYFFLFLVVIRYVMASFSNYNGTLNTFV